MWRIYRRRHAGLGRSRFRTRVSTDLSTRPKGCRFAKFYAFVRDNNFSSLFFSLLHSAMNLRWRQKKINSSPNRPLQADGAPNAKTKALTNGITKKLYFLLTSSITSKKTTTFWKFVGKTITAWKGFRSDSNPNYRTFDPDHHTAAVTRYTNTNRINWWSFQRYQRVVLLVVVEIALAYFRNW